MRAPTLDGSPSAPRLTRAEYPFILFLLLLDQAVHFFHSADFGLYEDDWFFCGAAYQWDTAGVLGLMVRQMEEFVFGRPLEIFFLYFYGWLGAMLDSIRALYWIAGLQWALVTVLLYLVLRRVADRDAALVAATFFVLSPLTTNRQFLNVAYKMAPAYALLLLALLLYLRGKRAPAFGVAFLTLFLYEWLLMPFFGAPLLDRRRPLRIRTALWHGAGCLGLVVAAFGLRMLLHESKAALETPRDWSLLRGIAAHTLFNLANIPVLLAHAVYRGLREFHWEGLVIGVLAVAVFRALLRKGEAGPLPGGAEALPAGRMLGAGAALTVLGLAPSFLPLTHRVLDHFTLMGRVTRVFGPSELGVAVTAGGIWMALRGGRWRRPAAAAGAMLAVCLCLYGFVIQHDYVEVWTRDRTIVSEILRLTPDAEPQSSIIVPVRWAPEEFFAGRERLRAVGEEKLMFSRGMMFLFGWEPQQPLVHFTYSGRWLEYLKRAPDGKLEWTAQGVPDLGSFERRAIAPGGLILLRPVGEGRWERRSDDVSADGVLLTRKPRPVAASFWATRTPTRLLRHVLPEGLPPLEAPPAPAPLQ
jgi:hypothetical protein